MKLNELREKDSFHSHPMKETCSCGKNFEIFTQKEDDGCEYIHPVYIQCDNCFEMVKFLTSVN